MRTLLVAAASIAALSLAAPALAADAGVITGRAYRDVYWFGMYLGTQPASGATVIAYPSDPGVCLTCRQRGPQRESRAAATRTDPGGGFRISADDVSAHPFVWAGLDYGTWFSAS